MSINQDILNDLANSTDASPDELKNATPTLPSVVPGRIETSQSMVEGSEGETPITDSVRSALLNPETTFNSVTEGVESVTSMGEVLNDIVKGSAISSLDMPRIVPRFEGFDKAFNPKSFTQQATRINFVPARTFMEKALATRMEAVASQLDFFFSSSLTGAEEGFELYRDFYGSETLTRLADFQVRLAKWKESRDHLAQQQLFLTDAEGKLVEINAAEGETSILGGDVKVTDSFNAGTFSDFHKAVSDYNNLKTINLLVGSLFDTVLNNKSIDTYIDPNQRITAYSQIYTCLDLLNVIGSVALSDLILKLEQATESAIERLKELEKECEPDPNNFDSITKFVTGNGAEIDKLTYYCHYYSETLDLIRRLFIQASGVLSYFETEK